MIDCIAVTCESNNCMVCNYCNQQQLDYYMVANIHNMLVAIYITLLSKSLQFIGLQRSLGVHC